MLRVSQFFEIEKRRMAELNKHAVRRQARLHQCRRRRFALGKRVRRLLGERTADFFIQAFNFSLCVGNLFLEFVGILPGRRGDGDVGQEHFLAAILRYLLFKFHVMRHQLLHLAKAAQRIEHGAA